MIEAYINIGLLIALCYTTYTDIKYHKIYNKITFSLMFLGIVFNTVLYGTYGFTQSLIGIITGFLLLISATIFIKGIGFGDVKLLMGIGALKGYGYVLDLFFFALFICILYQLIARRKDALCAIKTSFMVVFNLLFHKEIQQLDFNCTRYKFIFGPFIAIGAICALYTKGTLVLSLMGL